MEINIFTTILMEIKLDRSVYHIYIYTKHRSCKVVLRSLIKLDRLTFDIALSYIYSQAQRQQESLIN